MTTTTTTGNPTEKRKRTEAVGDAVEHIVERVDAGNWTDEQGMERLRDLAQYITASRSENDENFFRRIEELRRAETRPTT